jgi:hypothetical protein
MGERKVVKDMEFVMSTGKDQRKILFFIDLATHSNPLTSFLFQLLFTRDLPESILIFCLTVCKCCVSILTLHRRRTENRQKRSYTNVEDASDSLKES